MKILLDDKEYEIMAEQNAICKSLKDMLPLTMKLSRSGGHEYYASLPQELNVTGAESTSHVIAEISGGIESTLQDAPGTIEIRVLE